MPDVADDLKSVLLLCSFYGNVWEDSGESFTVLPELTSMTRTDDVSVARDQHLTGSERILRPNLNTKDSHRQSPKIK